MNVHEKQSQLGESPNTNASKSIFSNIKSFARLTGFLYFLLIPLGVFGILYVPASLIVTGDVAATANNIVNNEGLFRLSIVAALLCQLVNIAVVLCLYKILSPVSKSVAKLMVLFSLLAVPIAMLNELNKGAVLLVLENAQPSLEQMNMFLHLHDYGIQVAGIFFGLWLLPMGYLVFKSTFLPKVIGILLVVAGFGYLADSFVYFINPEFTIVFSEFTFIGEAAMTFWLLIKGVNAKQWIKQALNT